MDSSYCEFDEFVISKRDDAETNNANRMTDSIVKERMLNIMSRLIWNYTVCKAYSTVCRVAWDNPVIVYTSDHSKVAVVPVFVLSSWSLSVARSSLSDVFCSHCFLVVC